MAISYFGGKQKMAEWIYPFIPRDIKTYAEAFSGAFWVYMNINGDYSHLNTVVYNDINKHMVNLYSCMKEYDTFLKEFDKQFKPGGILHQKGDLETYKEDMKNLYYEFKKDKSEGNFLDNPPTQRPDFEAGVKYAFLITSAFNACYPRAAGCSAFNKDKLKLTALLNKLKDERYQSKFKHITNVENLDFADLINKYDSEDTFFYLDPPYEDQDNKRLDWYGVGADNAFGRSSHERLCKMLKNTKGKWALSYYYFEDLEKWLPKDKYRWEFKEFFRSSASFSDNKDVAGVEVLIMNYDISDEEVKENSKHFRTPTRTTKPNKALKAAAKKYKEVTKPSDELLDKVFKQVKEDIETDYTESVYELLSFIPIEYLEGYLPELEVVEEIDFKELANKNVDDWTDEELDAVVLELAKDAMESEMGDDLDESGLYEASGLKEVFEKKEEKKEDDFWD